MLSDRVKCAVANPGVVGVGSTITLGAASTGFRSFLTAFPGGSATSYFVLSDGAGKALYGVWTVNSTVPETATITEILGNDRLGGTVGETFSSACVAWNALPSVEVVLPRTSPYAGFRNLIINGNPLTNQRGYVSGTATVAANQYTLDRWRVVTSGQSITWADSAGIRTVTAPAGGMEQVIEGTALKGGLYTLNWTGTATATVNGVATVKKGVVALTGGATTTVRMSNGTWSELQLEPGAQATLFEQRPLAIELPMCQRYFYKLTTTIDSSANAPGASSGSYLTVYYPVNMRVAPTVVLSASGGINVVVSTGSVGVGHCVFIGSSVAAGLVYWLMTTSTTFSAEF